MSGLLAHVDSAAAPFPREEIRFAVILNGGVSLAVWMGGAVLELDRLTKAGGQPDPADPAPRGAAKVYAALLALAGSTARADVIAGTSAGGINGAALALSQVNPEAPLGLLRDIWVDQGRIEGLLRQPFRGSPSSLLQGDEFFLPQLNNALGILARPSGEWRPPEAAPIDLSITTTVLNGNQRITVDSMGQQLPQSIHGARFHWQRLPSTPTSADPFGITAIERTAHRLALASRSTASFPIAFEPSFVPVHSPLHADPTGGAALSDSQRLRPDMADVVKDWGQDGQPRNRSRFAVDGGLLANTPTRPALEAVESMPASGPVRRVMLLVFPHAEAPGADLPDEQDKPPTVVGAVGGILGALTAQGSRTFVDELEEHNNRAAGRRGTRGDVLRSVAESGDDPSAELESLALALYPHYRQLRRWRAARDLARRAVERPLDESGLTTALPEGWNYERVRRAAETAQDEWQDTWHRPSPYYPERMPRLGEHEPATGWRWGVTTALGVAETGADLLRRLIWVTTDEDYRIVKAARETISNLMVELRATRRLTDEIWSRPELAALQPNESYWSMRLASYEHLMGTSGDADRLAQAISQVAHTEANGLGSVDPAVADEVASALEATLTESLIEGAQAAASSGEAVRSRVLDVVAALQGTLPVLVRHCAAEAEAADEAADLRRWRDVLIPGGASLSDDELLTRLLQIEIAATTLGDEVSSGATLPVEVAQLSAQTANAFARYSRTGDDKLGGMSVNRFGGFLKRSWRVNDWIWGRADAASHLCRVVLQPARVRRAAQLSGYLSMDSFSAEEASAAAEASVTEIIEHLFPAELTDDPRIVTLRAQAVEELEPVLNPAKPSEDLNAVMPALADLFAWALHLEIVPSELPALAGAVRADGVEGANARSYGEVFVKEHELLLTRLDTDTRTQGEGPTAQDRVAALEAFDRAGIGREPLNQEGTSDQMIRTATTAAAVAATVVDSEQSGLTMAKPVTRTLRGAMLLPFWVVTGLTGKGVLARSFSVLALAVGAVLLALSLLGALPAGLSGPAAALGGAAVLSAFAIGALRSGTMLHGLVLLTPIVPLVVFAVERAWSAGDDGKSGAERGVSTLLVVIALALGLMALGSLPATTGSVWAALDRLADRQGLRPVGGAGGARRGLAQGRRRARGLAASAVPLALWVGATLGVVALMIWLSDEGWDWVATHAAAARPWLIAGALAATAIGVAVAFTMGRQLQVLKRQATDASAWDFAPVAHPAGASAGWAVLYGAGYLAIAAFLSTRGDWLEAGWMRALVAASVVLGALLILVVPLWLPLRALRRIADREVRHAVGTAAPPSPSPSGAEVSAAQAAAAQGTAMDLLDRGVAYRALVRVPRDKDQVPVLRWPLGAYLHKRIQREGARLGQIV